MSNWTSWNLSSNRRRMNWSKHLIVYLHVWFPRNRQVVKSDTIQYLEERDGHHHTSENIYNLSNYDVISDLTAGGTSPAPNISIGAELSGHENFGDNGDIMVDNELYIATVEHTC